MGRGDCGLTIVLGSCKTTTGNLALPNIIIELHKYEMCTLSFMSQSELASYQKPWIRDFSKCMNLLQLVHTVDTHPWSCQTGMWVYHFFQNGSNSHRRRTFCEIMNADNPAHTGWLHSSCKAGPGSATSTSTVIGQRGTGWPTNTNAPHFLHQFGAISRCEPSMHISTGLTIPEYLELLYDESSNCYRAFLASKWYF